MDTIYCHRYLSVNYFAHWKNWKSNYTLAGIWIYDLPADGDDTDSALAIAVA